MKLLFDIISVGIVICLWPSLLLGLGTLVLYKRPKRSLLALSAGLATAISGIIWIPFSGSGASHLVGWMCSCSLSQHLGFVF